MVISNLTLILLVLALCALFPTNIQATNSLSEKFNKCEKDFWFKNLPHYKQSLKSKCLKEKHHQKEKRHRQHHLCNNKSHDKKAILSKWNKFSNCRCESALEELKDKDSNILTCYQIAKYNKATGNFIGQLTVFKKNSDKHKYDLAVKFSDIKLNDEDRWSKTEGGYYRSKQSTEICNDKYSIETHLIRGKISKKESMNKISLNRISPLNIKFFDRKSKESTTLSKDQQVLIPFPKFLLNDENNPETPKINPEDSQDPNKSPAPPTSPAKQPSPDKQVNQPSDPTSPNSPTSPNAPNSPNSPPKDPNSPPKDPNSPPQDPNSPPENGPQADTNTTPGNTDNDNNSDQESSTAAASNPSPSTVASSNQEASVNQSNGAFTGLAIFGVIVSLGVAFVGYNTYERLKWRRHFRRGQAAAAQLNPSLANVPDYNGYGRAY